jgi:hypothetical protein
MHGTYGGHDQIHVANESVMNIAHIDTSIIPTSTRTLTLNNVLHVPSAQKNLLSVHHFTLYNDTFIEFHPYFFFLRIQKRGRYYCTDNVRVVFTPFHHLNPNSTSWCLVPSKSLLIADIVILVTPIVRLFIVLSPSIIYHVLILVV